MLPSFIHTCSQPPLKSHFLYIGHGNPDPSPPTVPLSSSSSPHCAPVLSLTSSSPSPTSSSPPLWYPTVLLASLSFPQSRVLSLSVFPVSLCPSVPNLSWAGSAFFPIICFWFPRIRKPLCARCLLRAHTRRNKHACTHKCTGELSYAHAFLLYYSIKVPINHWLLIGPRRPALPLSPSPLALKHRPDA